MADQCTELSGFNSQHGNSSLLLLLVVVVVMTSPSGTAYMGGQKCPEEMKKSTRLWIQRDPSLPRDSWQPFTDWGTPLKGGCRCPQLTYCQPLSNNRCWQMSTNCSSCSRFSDSVVGFTQPTASQYWRSNSSSVMTFKTHLYCRRFCFSLGNQVLAVSIKAKLNEEVK